MDRDSILNKIKLIKETVNSNDLPNIYLLHGDFSDDEMNEIYNHSKIKSMISLTKGEGFGRPIANKILRVSMPSYSAKTVFSW